MSFNKTVPDSAEILRLSAPKLRDNFAALEDAISEGHEFVTGGEQSGKHLSPTFKSLAEDPDAPLGADDIKLYNKGGELTLRKTGGQMQAVFPSGGIIMWSGAVANIPSGWALCNGANGTPDLRGRFVIGAGGSYAVGATANGTIPSHTHTGPSHTHTGPSHTHSGPSHTHGSGTLTIANDSLSGSLDARRIEGGYTNFNNPLGVFGYLGGGGSGTRAALRVTSDGSQDQITISHTHNHGLNPLGSTAASGTGATGASGTGNTGSSGTANTGAFGTGSEVIAKYYALAYIMKL